MLMWEGELSMRGDRRAYCSNPLLCGTSGRRSVARMSLGFRDLDVYQEAFRLGVWAGSFARQLKNARDQRLGDQIIRSARSVPANIAEAWRKRMYPAHFAAKITDAEAEAAETQVWIDFAYSDGLIDSTLHASHRQAYEKILTQLTNLRRTHTSRQAVPRPHQPRAQKP